jgi:hypothetical protein
MTQGKVKIIIRLYNAVYRRNYYVRKPIPIAINSASKQIIKLDHIMDQRVLFMCLGVLFATFKYMHFVSIVIGLRQSFCQDRNVSATVRFGKHWSTPSAQHRACRRLIPTTLQYSACRSLWYRVSQFIRLLRHLCWPRYDASYLFSLPPKQCCRLLRPAHLFDTLALSLSQLANAIVSFSFTCDCLT